MRAATGRVNDLAQSRERKSKERRSPLMPPRPVAEEEVVGWMQ